MRTANELDFGEVYGRYEALVRRTLVRRGIRRPDLDDVVQETFVTVHRLLPSFEGRASVETWLYAVTWRVGAAYHRRRRAQLAVAGPELEAARTHELSSVDIPGVEQLHSCLERLHPDDRDLFALHEVGGLSVSELSDLTGSSRATISERLERARRALGKLVSTPPPPVTSGRVAERPEPQGSCTGLELPSAQREDITASPFQHVHADYSVVASGDTVIAMWRDENTAAMNDLAVDMMVAAADRCGGRITYLSIIEPTARPPNRASREALRRGVRRLEGRMRAGAFVTGTHGVASLVAPIMNVSMFLGRNPLNMRFFRDLPCATAWLAPHTDGKTPAHLLQLCADTSARMNALGTTRHSCNAKGTRP